MGAEESLQVNTTSGIIPPTTSTTQSPIVISPKGSFKGYSFATYLKKTYSWFIKSENLGKLKILGTTAIALVTATYSLFGVGLTPEMTAGVTTLAGILFHGVTSAIQYRQKEVVA